MRDFYTTILNERGDVRDTLGTNARVVDEWWAKHGERELRQKLQELGRTDVLRELDKGMNLRDWYTQHGSQEYGNIWRAKGRPVQQQRQQFEKMLPYEQVFQPNLIRQSIERLVNPEIERERGQAISQQDRGFAQTGQYRLGVAGQNRNNLLDAFERQRKTQVADYTGRLNDITTDFYNRMKQTYYRNPDTTKPTLQSFNQFAKKRGGIPQINTNFQDLMTPRSELNQYI